MIRAAAAPLVLALAARAGQIVNRETLQAEVFGFDDPVGSNALEVNVTRLRSKLAPDGPAIRTVRGVGYMLDPSTGSG